jgi:hypothetical protein
MLNNATLYSCLGIIHDALMMKTGKVYYKVALGFARFLDGIVLLNSFIHKKRPIKMIDLLK